MAQNKRKVVYSEDDNDDPVPAEAPARNRRKSKPSQKQLQHDAEELQAEQRRIDAQQRALKKRQKEMKEAQKAQAAEATTDDDGDFESEEDVGNRRFTSSIQPLDVAFETPSVPPGPLRRVGPAAALASRPEAQRIPATAFKAVCPSDEPDSEDDQSSPRSKAEEDSSFSMPLESSSPTSISSTRPPLQPTTLPNIEAKTPAFRTNTVVNPKKPKASDYEDVVNALIIRAASEFEAFVCTKDAFPNTGTRHKWVAKVWKNANRDNDENYTITDGIVAVIRQRGSRIRGQALNVTRPYLINMLGFKKGTEPSTIVANQQLVQKWKPADGPRFPFKSPDDKSGYAEAKIISAIIEAVWFEDNKSQGVVFEKLFCPIPLETMALVLTIIDFCIDEWSTGRFVKAKMWEANVIERHKVFRKDLEGWSQINEVAVTGIRRKMFARASRNAGVVDVSTTKQTLVGDVLERAKQELEGRTGETDSEAEM